jgi:hypothetical protein
VIGLFTLLLFTAVHELYVQPAQILLWTEASPGTYSVKLWNVPPDFNPAHLSFTITSYDKRHVAPASSVVDRTEPLYSDGAKTRVDGVEVHVRIDLRALPSDMYTLSVRSPDTPGAFGSTSLQIYVPDRDAMRLAGLRSRYSGVKVWPYGTLGLRCDAPPFSAGTVKVRDVFVSVNSPLYIERIDRIIDKKVMMNDFSSNAGFRYEAIDPLEIRVRPPSLEQSAGIGWAVDGVATPGRDGYEQSVLAAIREHCKQYVAYSADEWDLERLVSLKPPDIDLRNRPDVIGLTHEEVAFKFGFPYSYQTRDEMLRMPEWSYQRAAPFSSSVVFSGDRAIRYSPPGNLP